MTSFGRLRQLEQERDLAETRLRRAQAGGDRRRPAGEPAATSAEDAPMLDLSDSAGPDEWDRL